MRHVVNERRNIEVHGTDVIWKLCTAQGKGQAQAWCEGSIVSKVKCQMVPYTLAIEGTVW